MAQVLTIAPHEHLSRLKGKQSSFSSSGRGGVGNIRRRSICVEPDPSSDQPSPCSCPSTATTERRDVEHNKFTSGGRGGGRGGSGSIQPSASDLKAHPLTASILTEHNALQSRYEKWVRGVYAESNVIRSSGRGGSGNISHTHRRSTSQDNTTPALKKRLFSSKRRDNEHDSDGTHADTQDDWKRASRATSSSGSSGLALSTQSLTQSNTDRMSNALSSSDSALSEPLPGDQRRRGFRIRWGKPVNGPSPLGPPRSPPSSVPASPSIFHGSSLGSIRAYSPTSVILEAEEYVSFLEL